ncbi:hypothetical protein [Thermococcus sp. MAR1]|uniref:hypothetical protein n=1 Tax=Thermococcus sp. MAR1 TaxID=1638263 RepID=UPI00143B03B3|nr:hypothetical protein [Thermococcus sp. MAR1]NJE09673.1 hypothetical protein [Thermococcus sp. MAR1]
MVSILERQAVKEVVSEYLESMVELMKEDEDKPFNLLALGSWPEPKVFPVGFGMTFGTFRDFVYPPIELQKAGYQTLDAWLMIGEKRTYIVGVYSLRKLLKKKMTFVLAALPHYYITSIKFKEGGFLSDQKFEVKWRQFPLKDSEYDKAKSAVFWIYFKKGAKIDYVTGKEPPAKIFAGWYELLHNMAVNKKWNVEGVFVKEEFDI